MNRLAPRKNEIKARRAVQSLFAGKKRKRRGKAQAPKFPKRVQMEFQAELRKLLEPIRAYARAELLTEIQKVPLAFRTDSISDELDRIMESYRAFVGRVVSKDAIRGILSRMGEKISRFNYKEVENGIVKTVGLNIFNDAAAREQVSLFVSRGTKLIESLASDEVKRVEQTIFAGASRGSRIEDVADELTRSLGISDSKARFLARDQTAKLNGELTEARQRSVGVEKYEWSTSLDERVRDSHAANEGKIFFWNDPPEMGHPGEDYNCRCVAIPVFDESETGE